jgi:hypothetical protein
MNPQFIGIDSRYVKHVEKTYHWPTVGLPLGSIFFCKFVGCIYGSFGFIIV